MGIIELAEKTARRASSIGPLTWRLDANEVVRFVKHHAKANPTFTYHGKVVFVNPTHKKGTYYIWDFIQQNKGPWNQSHHGTDIDFTQGWFEIPDTAREAWIKIHRYDPGCGNAVKVKVHPNKDYVYGQNLKRGWDAFDFLDPAETNMLCQLWRVRCLWVTVEYR